MPLPSDIHPVGNPFIELQSVDSTNNYALSQIHANVAQPGTCYFAHEQLSGKGQRGRSWTSEAGANIILSIVLKPSFLQPFRQFELIATTAVAVHAFLCKCGGGPLTIKWPNDLYWQNKKLGGILIENIIKGTGAETESWKWAVVGMGININQTGFPAGLKNPVSLKQITGKHFDTVDLAKELCSYVDELYKKLSNRETNAILETYNQFLYKKGETVKFKMDTRIFSGLIKNVTTQGQLIVQHSVEEQFDFGEIEWLI